MQQYAESVVVGEAEHQLAELIDDYRPRKPGRPRKVYQADARPSLEQVRPDRTVFEGKKYLPIGLVEFARGCRFKCDFCAVQSYFKVTQNHRPIDAVLDEVRRVKRRGQMIFFIDDNICSDLNAAKAFMRALIPAAGAVGQPVVDQRRLRRGSARADARQRLPRPAHRA